MVAVRRKKKYKTPRYPWQKDVLRAELELMGLYGLRNKKELWMIRSMLSRFRRSARELLAKTGERREALEKELLGRLYRLKLVSEDAILDDVLSLTVEDLLERRLQTRVFRLGLAKTPQQARQLVVHGHIAIGDRVVRSPSYLVKRDEEESIRFSSWSPLSNPDHPLREALAKGGVGEVERGER